MTASDASAVGSPPPVSGWRRTVVGLGSAMDRIEKYVLLPIAIVMLCAMILLVTADALLRYFAGSGLESLSEFMGKVAMPLLVFCSLMGLAASRGHVAVDILVSRYPDRLKRVASVLFDVFGAVFLVLIAYEFTRRLGGAPSGRSSTFVIPTVYPIAIVVVGTALGALRFLVTALQELAGVRSADADVPEEEALGAL